MLLTLIDCVYRPLLWAFSPKFRAHQRNVKVQNTHLDGTVHSTADPTCWYCQARSTDLRARGKTAQTDPRVLPS